jgi:phosphoesterase RecJ-like protein
MNSIIDNAGRVRQKIESSSHILITTHINPDGDAIGSGLAFLNILRNSGKSCNMLIPNDAPEFLKWMKSSKDIIVYKKNESRAKAEINQADLIIYVDFNDLKRLGGASQLFLENKKPSILIDHHPDPENFADIAISETSYGSASELVYMLIKAMDYHRYMDQEIAECLYTGIMTDTGNFSFACSYPEVWKNIGELIDYDIDRDAVFSRVYDNYKEDRMRLMGYCLNNKMQIIPEYNTAIITLTRDELKKYNYEPGDTEGFVNLPFSIKGIKFSVLMMEKKDHVKLSLRSRGNFSVNDFSRKHYDGGGHDNAAGAECEKPLDEVISSFISYLKHYKKELS